MIRVGGLTQGALNSAFDIRKAALDAAVMNGEDTVEGVISTAVKFEAYLRNGVKTEADAEVDPDDCTCIFCTLRKAIEDVTAEARDKQAEDQGDGQPDDAVESGKTEQPAS